jgi:hypothetical protein
MSHRPTQQAVTERVFEQRFSATRRGARLTRRLAVLGLETWGIPYGSELSDTVALVVGELAANSVLHGRVAGRDFELRLRHGYGDGRDRNGRGFVRIEVSDTHDRVPETGHTAGDVGDVGNLPESGHGLAIVEAVTARWGVVGRSGPGKTVWAEVRPRECEGGPDGGPYGPTSRASPALQTSASEPQA